ncbi:MAG: hypothetical protein NZL85_01945 [Fimbriimonadales bacterium]|nr:hypothetical protein [Fimbriimonadales bacterium]
MLTTPDGKRFQTYEALTAALEQAQRQLEQERQRAEAERERAERFAQKLRELGVEAD